VPAGRSLASYNAAAASLGHPKSAPMPTPEPLYTAANCRIAYQLHWSLTLFAAQAWPALDDWWKVVAQAVEPDGVRLLEFCSSDPATGQFLISTRPEVAPSDIVRSVKGRLQHAVRETIPQLWRRHYSIMSVGDANHKTLQSYIAGQVRHHPQADPRASERLLRYQFHDGAIDLDALRASTHGRFLQSLQVVFENRQHLHDTRDAWLAVSRAMLVAACRKKGWLLSRVGLAGNHLHVLVGCDVTDTPRDVALSLLNNLAFAHGMKAVYEPSFYVGTFGPYNQEAIRRGLGDASLPRP
jgi:REP element-mobilizing transposase RayT